MRHDKLPEALTPRGGLDEGSIHGVLGYQLAQATILTDQVFMQAAAKPLELRPVEFTILHLLLDNPGVTPTKLAQALAMTGPGVTSWLDRLEQRELVQRERSDTDRRAQTLRVTRKGSELALAALRRILEAEAQALEQLTPGERSILMELLQKVARLRQR